MKLPHISSYDRRWVRRLVILATLPIEMAHAAFERVRLAHFWWHVANEDAKKFRPPQQ